MMKSIVFSIVGTSLLAMSSSAQASLVDSGLALGEALGEMGFDTDTFTDFVDMASDVYDSMSDMADGVYGSDEPPEDIASMAHWTNCFNDPDCSACTGNSRYKVNNAYTVLVNNERLLARTMRQARMYENLAEGAASQHPAAKAAYVIQQAAEIEPAKRTFFNNYTKNQTEAVNVLRASLTKIGECEYEHLGQGAFTGLAEHTYQLAKMRFIVDLG